MTWHEVYDNNGRKDGSYMDSWDFKREGLVHEKTNIHALLRPFQQLVRTWQDALSFFEWAPLSDQELCNALQNELFICS